MAHLCMHALIFPSKDQWQVVATYKWSSGRAAWCHHMLLKTNNTDCYPTGTIPCSLHMVTMMAHDYTLQILTDLVPPTKLVYI